MFENTSANRDTKWLPNGVILAPIRAPNVIKIGVQNRTQKLKLKKKVTHLQVNPKETPGRLQGDSKETAGRPLAASEPDLGPQ